MPNVKKERSSDLDAARAVARALRSVSASAPVERGYVRFDASRIAGAKVAETTTRAPRPAAPRFGAASWERLLDDCIVVTESTDAFLMNEQGLVIALRGTIDADSAESIGSRTQLAMEQADRMATTTTATAARRTVMIELDGRWLVGTRFTLGDDTTVTLGLFCREPLGADSRRKLTALLDEIAARSDEPKAPLAESTSQFEA